MGESKRRGDVRQIATELTKRLTDEGKLVEAGWVVFRDMVVAKDAPDIQIDEMRMAFFAGAQHTFASMVTVLEEGDEPTEADMRRMDNLDEELERFGREFVARHVPTKGQA